MCTCQVIITVSWSGLLVGSHFSRLINIVKGEWRVWQWVNGNRRELEMVWWYGIDCADIILWHRGDNLINRSIIDWIVHHTWVGWGWTWQSIALSLSITTLNGNLTAQTHNRKYLTNYDVIFFGYPNNSRCVFVSTVMYLKHIVPPIIHSLKTGVLLSHAK